jgi:peptidylprolyl isomerase
MHRSVSVSLLLLALAACSSTPPKKTDSTPAQPATAATTTTPSEPLQTTPSGLQYRDDVVGTGAQPRRGQTIQVHYRGTLADGTEFDSSYKRGEAIEFKIGIGKVIQGWDEGVMPMRVGGKRHLVIPPELGYGRQGHPPQIPENATLTFDVELVGIR